MCQRIPFKLAVALAAAKPGSSQLVAARLAAIDLQDGMPNKAQDTESGPGTASQLLDALSASTDQSTDVTSGMKRDELRQTLLECARSAPTPDESAEMTTLRDRCMTHSLQLLPGPAVAPDRQSPTGGAWQFLPEFLEAPEKIP